MEDDYIERFEEPPICPLCEDVAMKETAKGYECPSCGAGAIWDEKSGEWRPYRTRAERWKRVIALLLGEGW